MKGIEIKPDDFRPTIEKWDAEFGLGQLVKHTLILLIFAIGIWALFCLYLFFGEIMMDYSMYSDNSRIEKVENELERIGKRAASNFSELKMRR